MITTKQDRFAQEWFATGNKSEAYRRAYSTTNMADKTINETASELSQHPKVSARYAELSASAQERNETNVDRLDQLLKESFEVAKAASMPSAMVSAAMGLVRLHGLDAESQRKMNDADKGNNMTHALRELAQRLPD